MIHIFGEDLDMNTDNISKERLGVLLYNAISLLEERVFDNYDTEARELEITWEEYCSVMDI